MQITIKPTKKYNKGIIKKCEVCGNEFKTWYSKIIIGRGKYCSKKCSMLVTNKILSKCVKSRFPKGNKPYNYKGRRYCKNRNKVYLEIYMPNHPKCNKSGYIKAHRLVMEKYHGRILEDNEVVHHLNNDGLDNRVSNLKVMNKIDHDRMNVNLNVHRRWIERKLPSLCNQ